MSKYTRVAYKPTVALLIVLTFFAMSLFLSCSPYANPSVSSIQIKSEYSWLHENERSTKRTIMTIRAINIYRKTQQPASKAIAIPKQ